jgi:hypothetical protein
MANDHEVYMQLVELVDPESLCWDLQQLKVSPQTCDDTLRYTRSVLLTVYSMNKTEIASVLRLLADLGAACDCQVISKLCGRLAELES